MCLEVANCGAVWTPVSKGISAVFAGLRKLSISKDRARAQRACAVLRVDSFLARRFDVRLVDRTVSNLWAFDFDRFCPSKAKPYAE